MSDRDPAAHALTAALAATSPAWLMSQSERMALLGILHTVKPGLVLEIGANEGGCTRWLCALSQRVYSVDIVNKLPPAVATLDNLTVFTMDSSCAFDLFAKKNERFNLIIIDGDHSREGSRKDTIRALECGSIIICHDSYNPACRQGYLDAIASTNRQVYFNPDFVQGTIHEGELWGGLGLIVTDAPAASMIPADDNYRYLHSCIDSPDRRIAARMFKKIKHLAGR